MPFNCNTDEKFGTFFFGPPGIRYLQQCNDVFLAVFFISWTRYCHANWGREISRTSQKSVALPFLRRILPFLMLLAPFTCKFASLICQNQTNKYQVCGPFCMHFEFRQNKYCLSGVSKRKCQWFRLGQNHASYVFLTYCWNVDSVFPWCRQR